MPGLFGAGSRPQRSLPPQPCRAESSFCRLGSLLAKMLCPPDSSVFPLHVGETLPEENPEHPELQLEWDSESSFSVASLISSGMGTVMSSPLAGTLVRGIRGSLCEPRDPESVGLTWPHCPWWESSRCPQAGSVRGRHSSVPAAAPALLATREPWFPLGPRHGAHDANPPPSPWGPSALILCPAEAAAPASSFPAGSCQSCSRCSAKQQHQGARCDVSSLPSFPP